MTIDAATPHSPTTPHGPATLHSPATPGTPSLLRVLNDRAALVLLIEHGRGRFQIKGQPIREFGPGEPIVLPANVPHWHGASPGEGLTWVALSIGRNVKWIEPVSEEEYLGKSAR